MIVNIVYSRKGGVDPYFHTFVMWASDWGWIEQTLNSRRSPPETEVFLSMIVNMKLREKKMSYSPLFHKIASSLVFLTRKLYTIIIFVKHGLCVFKLYKFTIVQ